MQPPDYLVSWVGIEREVDLRAEVADLVLAVFDILCRSIS